MPYKRKEIEKVYYRIGEVASMFDVNISLIRYWEKEFDCIKPYRNKKGNRFFTKNPEDMQRDHEIIKSLQQIKSFLLDLKGEL